MKTTRTMTVLTSAVLAAGAVAGCQGSGPAKNAFTPAATQAPTQSPTETPTAETTGSPEAGFPPQVQSKATALSGDLVGVWVSALGAADPQDFSQVVCVLSTDGGSSVRCDLVPDSPAQVDINKGRGSDPCNLAAMVGSVSIGYLTIVDGKADFGCPTDTNLGEHDVAVADGETVQLGNIQCTARGTGFACLDVTSGAAVLATLDSWKIYP